MPAPTISVIVPMFNAGQTLRAALASVAAQTASQRDFEVIIVDDSSTDASLALAQRWAGTVACGVEVIALARRRGPGHARNRGIERARGAIIVLLDADDELTPDSVAVTREFLRAHPKICYAYSKCVHIDVNGGVVTRKPGIARFSRTRLLHYNFVGHLKCFARSLHCELGGYDESNHAEDYDHVLRASELLRDAHFAHIPRYLYRYRLHGANVSWTATEAVHLCAAAAIRGSLRRKERRERDVAFAGRTAHPGGGYAYYSHRSG